MTYKKAESRRIIISLVIIFLFCIMIFFLFRPFGYNQSYLGGYKAVKQNYNAIELIFGCRRDKRAASSGMIVSGSLQAFDFSFINLLPHIFIILTILLLILKLFVKVLDNKFVDLLCALLMVIAGILLFFTHKFSNFMGDGKEYMHIARKQTFHLGWGAIVYGIVTLGCGILLSYSTVLAFMMNNLEDTDQIYEENEKAETEFRSKSMAELKAELLEELSKSQDIDITKDADLQAAKDEDLKLEKNNLDTTNDPVELKIELTEEKKDE